MHHTNNELLIIIYNIYHNNLLITKNIHNYNRNNLLLSCAVIKLDDSVCLILLNLVPCSGTDDSDPELASGTGGTI